MKPARRFLTFVVVAALAIAGPAAADDLDDELAAVEDEIEDLLAQIDQASNERSGLAVDVRASQSALNQLLDRLSAAQQALEDSTWQRNIARIELERARAAVADARVALADATEAVAEMSLPPSSSRKSGVCKQTLLAPLSDVVPRPKFVYLLEKGS